MSTLLKRNGLWPSTSFFDDFFTRDLFDWPGLNRSWTNEGNTLPRVNIVETNNDFKVETAAPGMKKEDIHIELDNDTLTIHSEVSDTSGDKDATYARREFSYHSFNRSFYLPNTVEAEKIEAKYMDGILSLVIPKKEEARKKPVKAIAIS